MQDSKLAQQIAQTIADEIGAQPAQALDGGEDALPAGRKNAFLTVAKNRHPAASWRDFQPFGCPAV